MSGNRSKSAFFEGGRTDGQNSDSNIVRCITCSRTVKTKSWKAKNSLAALTWRPTATVNETALGLSVAQIRSPKKRC